MKFLLFLTCVLSAITPLVAQGPIGGTSVANSPTLNGQITYRHLFIATVPLPSGTTAQQVWSNQGLSSYLSQSVVYRNWTGTQTARTGGTNATTNVIDDLVDNRVSVTIYTDSNSTNTLLINQLPLLNVTEARANTRTQLKIVPTSQVYRDFASNAEPSVGFINSTNLTYSNLGAWLDTARRDGVPDNVTFFIAFIPPQATSSQLPNFIYGYNIRAGNDTAPHNQDDVANMLINAFKLNQNRTVASSVSGMQPPGLRSHTNVKKIFAKSKDRHL